MRTGSLLRRIEKAEQILRARGIHSAECICFPQKESPSFSWPIEQELAARVKCPLHGDRFPPQFLIYEAGWLRDKKWRLFWTHHSEQYRKAWFASFPPDLWPATEEAGAEGEVVLRLKDGTILATGAPPVTARIRKLGDA